MGPAPWAPRSRPFPVTTPAVTTVIPATGKPDRESDNLKAGVEAMLDADQRAALIAEFDKA